MPSESQISVRESSLAAALTAGNAHRAAETMNRAQNPKQNVAAPLGISAS